MMYRATILACALALASGLAVAQTSLHDALASPWLHYGKQDQIWDTLDFNQDGQLSQYEWGLKGADRNWKTLLARDLDQDGMLSRQEFQQARQDLFVKPLANQMILEKVQSSEQLKEQRSGSPESIPESDETILGTTDKERQQQARRRDAMRSHGVKMVRPGQQISATGLYAGR